MDVLSVSAQLWGMKAIYLHLGGALALTFGLAACIPNPEVPVPAAPAPVVVPAPTPTPSPTPVVREPVYENYLDAPQTPGTWAYVKIPAGSEAVFDDSDTTNGFSIICSTLDRRIILRRPVAASGERTMQITTETTSRSLSAQPAAGGAPSVSLDPRDPLLDAMAITKGRFAVETEGFRTLYLPAWVEISRVIEDCR